MRFGDEITRNGFVNLGVYRPDLTTAAVGALLGMPFQSEGFSFVQRLSFSEVGEKGKNTYGGNYGRGRLPFHTDLAHWYRPPRYLVLRCVVPDQSVSTTVVQAKNVLLGMSTEDFRRAVFRPRRPLDGRMFLLRFYDGDMFRWDDLFIRPANVAALSVVIHITHSIHNPEQVSFRTPGETLIIDNWTCFHGRTPVDDPNSPRLIDRFYLSELYDEFLHETA